MKLLKITYQHRRDFSGVYKCEGCGTQKEYKACYDDRNFHDNVIPNRKCEKCGKSAKDLGVEIERVPTKYADYETI